MYQKRVSNIKTSSSKDVCPWFWEETDDINDINFLFVPLGQGGLQKRVVHFLHHSSTSSNNKGAAATSNKQLQGATKTGEKFFVREVELLSYNVPPKIRQVDGGFQ